MKGLCIIPYISVVVCTYNRADILKKCLESLVNQMVSKDSYEVIIIDNCSTDNTSELCRFFLKDNLNFKYIYESKIGLSNARNRGWQESEGKYIAYIDDDGIAYPNWLKEMVKFVIRHPDVGVFGGPYERYAKEQIPEWFPPDYGSLNLGDVERSINVGKEWIHGTNMVFKRELLDLYRGFLTDLGMKGSKLSYGEETRLIKEIYDAGHDIYYNPHMKVQHLIKKKHMTLWGLLKDTYIKGKNSSQTFKIERSFVSYYEEVVFNLIKTIKIFIKPGNMPLKRRLYYSLSKSFYAFGILMEFILGFIGKKRKLDKSRTK